MGWWSGSRKAAEFVIDGLGRWLLGITAVIILPCLPLAVEMLRTGSVTNENLLLTAAVLAAVFIFSAEHHLTLSAHILMFVGGLLLTVASGPSSPVVLGQAGGYLLATVTSVHAMERLWWHMFQRRPFPDRIRIIRE